MPKQEPDPDGCELDFAEHAMDDDETARLLDPDDDSRPLDVPIDEVTRG